MSVPRVEQCLWALFAAFMIAVPWIVPALSSSFWVSVIAEILIWSLLAASVNLLFGYVGLLSFGQALYFGFGMYGVAIGIEDLGFRSGLLLPSGLSRPWLWRWPPASSPSG